MMIPDDYIRRILNIIELLLVPITQTVSEQYGGVHGTAVNDMLHIKTVINTLNLH